MTPEKSLERAHWHEEPPAWSWQDGVLHVRTAEKTDFWQHTFYGFHRDDGHFLGLDAEGDFTAMLGFDAEYEVLYDQAGLMLRKDAQNWLKTGIEYTDGAANFSVVITQDGQSDWSVIPAPGALGVQRIRLSRIADSVIVHYRNLAGIWQLMRVGHLPAEGDWRIGPMTCSPERAGLKVQFVEFELGPPAKVLLHAD